MLLWSGNVLIHIRASPCYEVKLYVNKKPLGGLYKAHKLYPKGTAMERAEQAAREAVSARIKEIREVGGRLGYEKASRKLRLSDTPQQLPHQDTS